VTKFQRVRNEDVIAVQFRLDLPVNEVIKEFGENPVRYDFQTGYFITSRDENSCSCSAIHPLMEGDYIVKENASYKVLSERDFLKQYRPIESSGDKLVIHIHNHFGELDVDMFASSLKKKLEEFSKQF